MSDSKSRSLVFEAEQFVPEPVKHEQPKKRLPGFRSIMLAILCVVFIVFAVGFFADTASQAEPSYELPPVDSTSIAESALLLESYVIDHGRFPEGFEDYIASTPGITLTVNDDGSFSYSEENVLYRSVSGILTAGGEL